jgi:hypothetical protein
LLLTVLILAFALPACGGDSDDTTGAGGDPASVTSICAKVFTCFDEHWGWDTEANCELLWLTDCKKADAYLACAKACVDGACDAFETCECACWDGNCP